MRLRDLLERYGDAISYRRPMAVRDARTYPGTGVYPVCPRCRLATERDYQSYCDRCGQALDWSWWRGA